MALFITSLNSGSNGNCYYIGNQSEAVLVDVGISCREVEKRMTALGLSMDKLRAILVSHEHGDHIKGIPTIANKYQLPVYISGHTWLQGNTGIPQSLVKNINVSTPFQIGELNITAFSKQHDAADPHSFIISFENVTVGVFTDIGIACENVTTHFRKCHAAFLETNYDEAMLENGRYPLFLKNRIRGGKGHLSNVQALEIFIKYRPPFMSHLLLSHLSSQNNDPDLVMGLFKPHCGNTRISVASRFKATPVYHVENRDLIKSQVPITVIKLNTGSKQLNLFG